MSAPRPRPTLLLAILWSAAMIAWGVARGPLTAGAPVAASEPSASAGSPAPAAPAGSRPPAAPAGSSSPAAAPAASTGTAGADDLSVLGDGVAVWESARSGSWRLWMRRFGARAEEALTPAEPSLRHCCPHLSPDGSRLAYLAVSEGRYGEREVGELRLLSLDPSARTAPARPAQVIAPRARTYGAGHRAAAWHGRETLQFIDESGDAIAVDLLSGKRERLAGKPPAGEGWLIDATRRHATSGAPTFSVYHADRREVAARNVLGGCEPYFSHDGRWGVWVAGAGGPVYRIELGDRAVSRILSKNDERVAGGRQGYVYFPMLSRDSEALTFGASVDEHDHNKGNYDVFVVPTDPRTLDLAGPVLRVTADAGSDRYPDVHLAPGSAARRADQRARFLATAAAAAPPRAARRSTWPSDREGLVFLFERGDAQNLVGSQGREHVIGLEPRGRARFDHAFALLFGGGAYAASVEGGREITEALKRSNEMTIELTLRPDRLDQRGTILSLAGPKQPNIELVQHYRTLAVRLLTAREVRQASVATLQDAGAAAPRHVAIAYAPGSLTAWVDGRQTVATAEFQRDFFQWRPSTFALGNSAAGDAPWSGVLSTIALYDRALSAEEVAENARLAVVARGAPPPPRLAVTARLRQRSRLPTLDEIAPYRQAMAVFEYEVEQVVSTQPGAAGAAEPRPGERIRVAHWTILDAAPQPEAALADGARVDLLLEPFASQPQLETVVVKNTLAAPSGSAARLYLDVRP